MALPPVGRRTSPTPSSRQAPRSTSRPRGWPKPSETVGGSHAKNLSVGGAVPARRPRDSASSIAMFVAPSTGSVTSRRHVWPRGLSVTALASHGTAAPAPACENTGSPALPERELRQRHPRRAIERGDRHLRRGELLSFPPVPAGVPEVAAARRRSRMDDRDVWRERDRMERWAQHVLTQPAVAAVEVVDGAIDAALRPLQAPG